LTGDVEEVHYRDCELSVVGDNCGSEGAKPGEITKELTSYSDTRLIDHGELGASGGEPSEGEVWDEFLPEEGSPVFPYQAIWVCRPGILFRLKGSLSGIITPVDAKASAKATITVGKGKANRISKWNTPRTAEKPGTTPAPPSRARLVA
jgi:hypothetical protein